MDVLSEVKNSAAAGPDHPPLILLVEDEASLLDVFCELLEEEGFRVIPWPAPPAEPAYVATLLPDLIILDLRIADTDPSWHFLERLKTDAATAAVPVLVCADHVTELERVADRLASWTCGALPKPFALEPFLDQVRSCLGQAIGPGPD